MKTNLQRYPLAAPGPGDHLSHHPRYPLEGCSPAAFLRLSVRRKEISNFKLTQEK